MEGLMQMFEAITLSNDVYWRGVCSYAEKSSRELYGPHHLKDLVLLS